MDGPLPRDAAAMPTRSAMPAALAASALLMCLTVLLAMLAWPWAGVDGGVDGMRMRLQAAVHGHLLRSTEEVGPCWAQGQACVTSGL